MMKSPPVRSTALRLVSALSFSLLVGCVNNQERRPEKLSSKEFRFLYPRKHLDSLESWERSEAERRMMQEDFQERARDR